MELSLLRQRIGYQGALLAAASLITTGALVVANIATAPAIRQAAAHDLELSLAQVLPAGFADNDLLADVVRLHDARGTEIEVHRARKGSAFTGAVFQTEGSGYAGAISLLVGISRDGVVQGVRVLRHAETPGLGDKIEVAKSPWIRGFEGKSLANAKWGVKKDGGEFDQFAGATITPRGVVKAVKEAIEFHQSHLPEIYATR